jgi:hypothetical protein
MDLHMATSTRRPSEALVSMAKQISRSWAKDLCGTVIVGFFNYQEGEANVLLELGSRDQSRSAKPPG